jgi:hypothetical protein
MRTARRNADTVKQAEAETNAALKGIRKIGKETGFSMSDISIKWILEIRHHLHACRFQKHPGT